MLCVSDWMSSLASNSITLSSCSLPLYVFAQCSGHVALATLLLAQTHTNTNTYKHIQNPICPKNIYLCSDSTTSWKTTALLCIQKHKQDYRHTQPSMYSYLDIGVQVVNQVFFMALCDYVEQHSADTAQQKEFNLLQWQKTSLKCCLTQFLFIVSLEKLTKQKKSHTIKRAGGVLTPMCFPHCLHSHVHWAPNLMSHSLFWTR